MKYVTLIKLAITTILMAGCAARDDSNPTASDKTSPTTVMDIVDTEDAIIFRESRLPHYVSSISGLSGAESFGRWSEQKVVTIQFNKFLPKNFILAINAGAYSKNRKSPAIIHAGLQERKLLIDAANADPKDFSVNFTDVENASSLIIEVPEPTTPKSIGQGEDIRPLGYSFVTLSIRSSE